MEITQVLSSANSIIKFRGEEVGAIQNLRINTLNNVSRINSIFGTYTQKFVRGTLEYTIIAEKAFIDLSSFYGGVNTLLKTRNNLSSIMDNVSDLQGKQLQLSDAAKVIDTVKNAADFVKTLWPSGSNVQTNSMKSIQNSISGVIDSEREKEESDDILQKRVNAEEIMGNRVFDIEISSPIQTGFLVGSTANSLWTLKDCKIVGRDIKLDINNILILEGLVLFAKKLTDEYLSPVTL